MEGGRADGRANRLALWLRLCLLTVEGAFFGPPLALLLPLPFCQPANLPRWQVASAGAKWQPAGQDRQLPSPVASSQHALAYRRNVGFSLLLRPVRVRETRVGVTVWRLPGIRGHRPATSEADGDKVKMRSTSVSHGENNGVAFRFRLHELKLYFSFVRIDVTCKNTLG